jgi:hypothetical protein
MRHVFHGGHGSQNPDGFPFLVPPRGFAGRFFGVEENGDLRFWLYTGSGEHDPSGATGFDGLQGTVIGNGFDTFLHVLGGGDGIILGVTRDGDLTFFRYTGGGEEDRSGTLGFEGNQGTVIGNGFHTFPHIFVAPRDGETTLPATTIFTVDQQGDLRWFRYTGNGEHDPTGASGFDGPNQGNQIGNGFTNFRHIVGVGGGAFVAVPENGDLLWFRYTGNGEHDPSGANGFVENNSGNQIGNGFGTFRHLFGGLDRDRRSRLILGVTRDGDLLYFRYTGNGEHDPTGTRGFDTGHQGTQIGNGF